MHRAQDTCFVFATLYIRFYIKISRLAASILKAHSFFLSLIESVLKLFFAKINSIKITFSEETNQRFMKINKLFTESQKHKTQNKKL